MNSKDFFTCRWEVGEILCKYGDVWISMVDYSPRECVWEFGENRKFTEYLDGRAPDVTTYNYFPSRRLLSIDRADYEYRVEHICADEYHLYYMGYGIRRMEDCEFRIRIRRLGS